MSIMQLEKQVVSLELAKQLKELGVEQESLFYYKTYIRDFAGKTGELIYKPNPLAVKPKTLTNLQLISAFTVAELGEMLKCSDYYLPYSDEGWTIWEGRVANSPDGEKQYVTAPTEADARAKMLIYLLENNLLTK